MLLNILSPNLALPIEDLRPACCPGGGGAELDEPGKDATEPRSPPCPATGSEPLSGSIAAASPSEPRLAFSNAIPIIIFSTKYQFDHKL